MNKNLNKRIFDVLWTVAFGVTLLHFKMNWGVIFTKKNLLNTFWF
jgi:hypothetical protein